MLRQNPAQTHICQGHGRHPIRCMTTTAYSQSQRSCL